MYDADYLIAAITGRAASAEQVAAAREFRNLLVTLRLEIDTAAGALVPPSTGAWRSNAADRYAERLDALRAQFRDAGDALGGAESELDERIRRMEAQLAAFAQAQRDAEEADAAARQAALAEDARDVRRAEARRTQGEPGEPAWTTH